VDLARHTLPVESGEVNDWRKKQSTETTLAIHFQTTIHPHSTYPMQGNTVHRGRTNENNDLMLWPLSRTLVYGSA
jgi:hypothetical protein